MRKGKFLCITLTKETFGVCIDGIACNTVIGIHNVQIVAGAAIPLRCNLVIFLFLSVPCLEGAIGGITIGAPGKVLAKAQFAVAGVAVMVCNVSTVICVQLCRGHGPIVDGQVF